MSSCLGFGTRWFVHQSSAQTLPQRAEGQLPELLEAPQGRRRPAAQPDASVRACERGSSTHAALESIRSWMAALGGSWMGFLDVPTSPIIGLLKGKCFPDSSRVTAEDLIRSQDKRRQIRATLSEFFRSEFKSPPCPLLVA